LDIWRLGEVEDFSWIFGDLAFGMEDLGGFFCCSCPHHRLLDSLHPVTLLGAITSEYPLEIAANMASELSAALAELHLAEKSSPDTIDDVLFQKVVRRPKKQHPDQLRAELENKYLEPSPTFSTECLSRLQQQWDARGGTVSPRFFRIWPRPWS